MDILTQLAAAETTEKPDLFSSIGIDWKLLVLQAIAFLILLWFLKKFVYPPLVAMLDKRERDIAAAAKATREAQESASKSEEMTKKLLDQARAEAKDIVATAKNEATLMITDAEQKSKLQAEQIVAKAHEEIAKEVIAAKKALHNETIELVASATERVVGKVINDKVDTAVIETSLKEVA